LLKLYFYKTKSRKNSLQL